MSNPLVTINIVVLNGEKYIRHCLDGISAQTYPHELIEFNILDNGSVDNTKNIIRDLEFRILDLEFTKFNFIESKLNLGMWPGQEELLKYSTGKYVLAMAVDVVLDKDFINNAVEIMERDVKLGALQAKIYKFDLEKNIHNSSSIIHNSNIIDTCGFKIFKSRRIINIGHGEEDRGQYDNIGAIFGVEGAAPFFRREAIEDIHIDGKFIDDEYFWYGDDLDLAWRMTLLGWKQIFAPTVIAWHDRQTTKKLKSNFKDFLEIRRKIPIKKRRLEWLNIRFTIIKNDYIISILRDLPYIFKREVAMLGYLILFEPSVLIEIPKLFKLLPNMINKRRLIMRRSKISPKEIHKFFE